MNILTPLLLLLLENIELKKDYENEKTKEL